MKKINLQEVKQYLINQDITSKIYIGADSVRFRQKNEWYAEYTLVVVVHIGGKHGCKIFGEIHTEKDFDQRKDKPSLRLMNEVYKVSNLFQQLKDVLHDREVEVHLDINPNDKFGSSCVVQQAIGYIKGTCNVIPLVKPHAFAASYAADRLKHFLSA